MEFRLLGPLELGAGGRRRTVGSGRQRSLLAALLVRANQVVPAAELVDRVWSDESDGAPAVVRGVLHTYVMRLRRTLSDLDPAADLIRTHPGGYSIRVEPGWLDVDTFHALLDRARQAAADGDRPAESAHLAAALALWRGPALADVPSRALRAEFGARLGEQRLAALDRRIAADLDLGRHGDLVAELHALTAEHPLRERFWAQLMTALYRCGRQAEALTAYQTARALLVESLGVEPDAELRDLERAILNHDATLTLPAPAPATASAARAVPRQLPADVAAFTGRESHLAALDALLPGDGEAPDAVVISAVDGTPGVGKTALAVHWAHRVAHRFPDGQLYVNLRGFDPHSPPVTASEAVRGFLDALGVPPSQVPTGEQAQAALYRSRLAGRRVLVVLDNARDADQVRPLLPGAPGCLVVVTSRNQLAGLVAATGAHPLRLDLLSDAEARHLLARRLGADRVAAEPEAVGTITDRCARLPLALAVVAARAATHPSFPLAVLAKELDGARRGVEAFTGGDAATDVRAVLSWSYKTLDAPAARLFRLLGLHPGPDIATGAAASLAGDPPGPVRSTLARLSQANLLVEHVPGRYTCHDLLRAYAAELAHTGDPDADRRAATVRMLDHYLQTAHAASHLLDPHRDPVTPIAPQSGVTPEEPAGYDDALAWFAAEHRVLLAIVDRAVAEGFDTHAWQLAWYLVTFLDLGGHWADVTSTQRAAEAAARRAGAPDGQARAHRALARACLRQGSLLDAHTHLRQAIHLYGLAGDGAGQGNAYRNMSLVLDQLGRHEEAIAHARRSLECQRTAGNRTGEAHALNSLGYSYSMIGDHEQALAYCGQALAVFEELGDRHGLADTWDSLGHAHHHLGHRGDAVTCYRRAADLYDELSDRYNQAWALARLGDACDDGDADADTDEARAARGHAVEILEELGHPDADRVRASLAGPVSERPGR